MQVSSAYIDQFNRYLESVNEAAGREIISELDRRRITDMLRENPDAARREVAVMIREICGGLDRLSSAITCQFYDGIRNGMKLPTEFKATLWEGIGAEALEKAANAIVNEVIDGRATVPLGNLLRDYASKVSRTSANGTIRRNVMRDPAKPRYAIVPQGDACAFCVMRASRTYYDEPQPESHSHCSCTAVPLFKAKVQGYDQSLYKDMWDEAAEAYRSGDISEDLKERIAAQKAEKGRDFDSANAILMVMREQQGIK